MKYNIILFLCLWAVQLQAQDVPSTEQGRILVAEKGERFRFFLPGAKLRIGKRDEPQKIHGKLLRLTDSSIWIQQRYEEINIPLSEIVSIKKVDPFLRVAFGAAGAIALSGSLLLATRARSLSTLFLIPVTAAGVYSLGAVPVSYLVEEMEKKHRKRGWHFHIRPKSWLLNKY